MTTTLDVIEASRRLGLTPDAVRAKLRRGTLEGYRDNHGNWRVVWDDRMPAVPPEAVDAARQDEEIARLEAELERERGEREADRAVNARLAAALQELLDRIAADEVLRQAEIERLTEERDRLRDRLVQAKQRAAEAEGALTEERGQASALAAEVRHLKERLDAAAQERASQIDRIKELSERVGAANTVRQAAEREADSLRRELDETRRPWWRRRAPA